MDVCLPGGSPAEPPLRSKAVGGDESNRVHADVTADSLVATPRDGVETLYDLCRDAFSSYAGRKCMGTRELLGEYKPRVKHFGEVKWRTYEEVGKDAFGFGAALRSEGLVSAPDEVTMDKLTTPCALAIFENTCAEWMISAMGAFSQSIIVTTVYATLGMDAVVEAVNEGIITAMVCNKANVEKIVGRLGDMPTLKTIIFTSDMVDPKAEIKLPEAPEGVKIVSFEDFIAGADTEKFPPTPPKKDTTAVIMYTSGSTGKPKGVVIKHSAIVANIGSAEKTCGIKNGEDVAIGYLPLAHVFELVVELTFIGTGCTICYADPRTLTSKGAYPMGALEQYSPTMMIGVPKIWDVIKKGVEAKIAESSGLKQFLFRTAFNARARAISQGGDSAFWKALVFNKLSGAVGGRLRLAMSAGGPLNEEVQVFIRTCFGCPLFQGYGLTETCAPISIQDPLDVRAGIAGVPVPSVEVKLDSCPDITDRAGKPYLSTDKTDVDGNPIFGRGEVCARGNSLSSGYYMMPDKTREEFGEDGYFHTGDIGQFMSDGSLRIVDRKKNLVKLKGAEYIALEKMEAAYGNSKFVDALAGGICCYGDADMDRPIAFVQLNRAAAAEWAKGENGISGEVDELKNNEKLHEAVLADMKNEAKKGGLSRIEALVAVILITEPWTPENGCLTAANKIQRKAVLSAHEKEFNETKPKGIF